MEQGTAVQVNGLAASIVGNEYLGQAGVVVGVKPALSLPKGGGDGL